VHSYLGSRGVVERSVGGLKDPMRDVCDKLTFVDLDTFAGDSEDGALVRGRVSGVMNLSGGGNRKGCGEDDEEALGSIHPQEFTPLTFQGLQWVAEVLSRIAVAG
jgi:hypothetical protein